MKAIRVQDFGNSTISDEDAIKRILAGEKELYELLMRRYNQKLYRVVVGYLKDGEDIADVMQDSYLKAYEKLYQFKFNASFSTWLIRIAINEALAKIRYKGKYAQLNRKTGDTTILEIPEASQPNPEKRIIQQEAKQMLEKTIAKLESKYRIIYILREIEGMSIAEIGACLHLTNTNVKVRLHRAKKMIKDALYESSITTEIFEFGSTNCDRLVQKVMLQLGEY